MGAKNDTPGNRALRRLIPDPETGCWNWTGSTDKGYGRINVNGKPVGVHRVMYEVHYGQIPENLSIDHLCRNTRCANPDHLEAVTLAENTKRQLEAVGHHNEKKTHCPQGHPYDEHNTGYASNGYGRVCRICRRVANREYRKRLKQKKEETNV